LGAIGIASREKLDNLIFVVNCNLQRLDGPVRGNGKIIQELEGDFRGAGWNVIKVIWGSYWDPLLARDKEGRLLRVMEESVDGEYQNYKANDGAFVRKNFFGKDPKVAEMVARMSDEDNWRLNRGGHDAHKAYAADAAPAEGRQGAGRAAARGVRPAPEGLGRRARDLHHHGVRARAHRADPRQGHRQAHRADRAGRGAHLRHGRHVPPARHLCRRGPE